MDFGEIAQILPPEDAGVVCNVMLISEYRNSQYPYQKVAILLKYAEGLSVAFACKILKISTKTYYKQISNAEVTIYEEGIDEHGSPRRVLLPDEEKFIINKIREQQMDSDCMTQKDIRKLAADLFTNRTGDTRTFDRFWFYRFIQKYEDVLKIRKCPSVDDERGNLEWDKFIVYFERIKSALPRLTDLRLLINMDESGFGTRPDKGKRKNCIFCSNCPTTPVWRAQTDPYHVSWVAAITANCDMLRPMFITTRKTQDPEFYSTFLPKFGDFTFAEKGYQTMRTMTQWIETILTPHVLQCREDSGNPNSLTILIMDGLNSHFHPDIIQLFERLRPIEIIDLPPHSSHFTQPCDGPLFASAKTRYNSISKPDCESKYQAKLLRIKKAIQQSITDDIIHASWKKCGFDITIEDGFPHHVSFRDDFADYCHCQVHENDILEETEQITNEIISSQRE